MAAAAVFASLPHSSLMPCSFFTTLLLAGELLGVDGEVADVGIEQLFRLLMRRRGAITMGQ
jgi:hypothetical protein